MNLFQDLKERAKSFISGASSFKIQDTVTAKVVTLVGIIPKKTIPKQLVDAISKPLDKESIEADPGVTAPKKVVSSLGKLTLDLVQINNNLEKIADIVQEDYKNTKELNKKESEDYKKRIANRFRTLGKKDYKSNKVDVSNLVKNFAGSFFKGVGGAIRALAAFNFLDALMRGDPAAAVGALLGMASTYIPAIIGGVVGGITSSIFGGIKNLFKGGKPAKVPTATPTTAAKPAGPKKFPGMGKWGKMLALGTSALALGSAFGLANKEEDPEQTRLEELTQQQKAAVEPDKLVPIPQDDLKRFEDLNKRFEKAIEFLLGKQKEGESTRPSQRSGGRGSGGSPGPGPSGEPPITGEISGNQAQVESQMFDYLKGNYGENVAYGMLSNSMRESGYRTDTPDNQRFQGMFQWSRDARWPELVDWARSQGLDPMDRGTQLRYALKEAEASGTLGRMRSARTPEEASSIFYNEFERGAYSKPITGSSYTADNPHEQKNKAFLRDIQKRQSKRTPGTLPGSPAAPALPSPSPSLNAVSEGILTESVIERPSSPRQAPRPITPNRTPQVIPLPIQQPSRQVPLAGTVDETDVIPSIETNYSENFLSVYSKLIYQIV